MIKVPVVIQGMTINAIIDTASQVALISDTLYNNLVPKPGIEKYITLYAAGRDMAMKGYLVEPTTFSLNGLRFR